MKRHTNPRPDYRVLVKEFEGIRHQVTQRQFCLDADIVLPTFQSWLYRLRQDEQKQSAGFSRLAIVEPKSLSANGIVEIHYPDQTILKMPAETSVEVIIQLLPQFHI